MQNEDYNAEELAEETYPELATMSRKQLIEALGNEIHDVQMYASHCTQVYEWCSGLTKPNTLPKEVIQLAEDKQSEWVNACVDEALANQKAEFEAAHQSRDAEVEGLRAVVEKLPVTADGVRVVPTDPIVWLPDGRMARVLFDVDSGTWAEPYKGDVQGDRVLVFDCYSTESAARSAMEGGSDDSGR